ncbi:hypothetical protein HUU59_08255 [bacterium]|nr:hypothetical protein [bacterium]
MSYVRHGRNFRGRKSTRRSLPESLDGYVVQVHFAGRPGTTKRTMNSLRHDSQAYLDALREKGQLLYSGRYLSSVGGMWLIKVRAMIEAEKLAHDYPPVRKDLLTFRINVLMDRDGVFSKLSTKRTEDDLQPA